MAQAVQMKHFIRMGFLRDQLGNGSLYHLPKLNLLLNNPHLPDNGDMKFKYTLPANLSEKVRHFVDYANGAHQVTIKLKNGKIYNEALISNSKWIIALWGYETFPFDPSDIEDVFQVESDKIAKRRQWFFWDKWR